MVDGTIGLFLYNVIHEHRVSVKKVVLEWGRFNILEGKILAELVE